jgi:hypothetical protein
MTHVKKITLLIETSWFGPTIVNRVPFLIDEVRNYLIDHFD